MATEVILLERIDRLGQMGEVVKVKPGFARNFLLPQRKALRATKENLAFFEAQRKVLEQQNNKKKEEAEKLAKKLADLKVVVIRQAAEGGQLYGSVAARDIADAITAGGNKIDRHQVYMNQAFKNLGIYPLTLILHPEVKLQVSLNIARSEEEAKIQEKLGKAATALAAKEEEDARAKQAAEAIFEKPPETDEEEAA